MAEEHLKCDVKDIGIYRAINNITRYNTLFFHIEWTRSISYRPNTLTTHASIYKNHRVLHNTNLKRCYYISNILDNSWLSPVNIESMGENFASVKVDHKIFNSITWMGLKKGDHR